MHIVRALHLCSLGYTQRFPSTIEIWQSCIYTIVDIVQGSVKPTRRLYSYVIELVAEAIIQRLHARQPEVRCHLTARYNEVHSDAFAKARSSVTCTVDMDNENPGN